MRTLIDISQETVAQLDLLAKHADVSRASLIRKAIDDFLNHQRKIEKNVFGILKNEKFPDALEFQNKIRDEWI